MRCVFDGCCRPVKVKSKCLCGAHAIQLQRGESLRPVYEKGGPCQTADCARSAGRSGLCRTCYARARRNGEIAGLVRSCGFAGCENNAYAVGLCIGHYQQHRVGRDLVPLQHHNKGHACSVSGCVREARCVGLCDAHWQQQRQGRELGGIRQVGTPNEVIVDGDVAWIVLTGQRGQEVARTCVDAHDVDIVRESRWRRTRSQHGKKLYVVSHRFGSLHRLLTDCPDDMEVDHVDGDPLNNRRNNLRIVTHAENAQNVAREGREHLRGVSQQKDGSFIAYAIKDGRMHFVCGIRDLDSALDTARQLRCSLMTHNNENRH